MYPYHMLKTVVNDTALVCGDGLRHDFAASDVPEAETTMDITEAFIRRRPQTVQDHLYSEER